MPAQGLCAWDVLRGTAMYKRTFGHYARPRALFLGRARSSTGSPSSGSHYACPRALFLGLEPSSQTPQRPGSHYARPRALFLGRQVGGRDEYAALLCLSKGFVLGTCRSLRMDNQPSSHYACSRALFLGRTKRGDRSRQAAEPLCLLKGFVLGTRTVLTDTSAAGKPLCLPKGFVLGTRCTSTQATMPAQGFCSWDNCRPSFWDTDDRGELKRSACRLRLPKGFIFWTCCPRCLRSLTPAQWLGTWDEK